MEEYIERQRKRYEQQKTETPVASSALSQVPSATSGASAVVRLHVLPLEHDVRERGAVWMPQMRSLMERRVQEGDVLLDGSAVVAKTEPAEGGMLTGDTEIFLDGPVVPVCRRLQFVLLGDPREESEEEESEVFERTLGPFLQRRLNGGRLMLVTPGSSVEIEGRSFHVAAVDAGAVQPTGLCVLDRNTMVYLNIDRTEEYTRIHVVPYQETLPRAYDFDVFADYLRPFFRSHLFQRFSVNQSFAYNGVQFRIVAVEPDDDTTRRVGRRTIIFSEGVVSGNMRQVLPVEVMEQLALLPPGLQLLLLNSDAALGGFDRLAGIEQTLNTRRGLDEDTIAMLPEVPWTPDTRQDSSCCLAEFRENEAVRKLPCAHVYHAPCIDEWLRRNTDCPLCKANVDRSLRGY